MQSDGNLFSANHLIKYQPQFKPLHQGLQSATKMGLQSALGWWITECGKMDYKVRLGLQSVAGCITKCVRDYKMWRDYKVS